LTKADALAAGGRRPLLFVCIALLLVAAGAAQARSKARPRARSKAIVTATDDYVIGLDLDGLNATVRQSPPGMRPSSIHAYRQSGQIRFAVAWAPSEDKPWWWAWGVDGKTFSADLNAEGKDGYEPVRVSAYATPEGPRYDVITEKGLGNAWWVSVDDEDQFKTDKAKFPGQGYRLADFVSYLDGGRPHFVLLWVKDNIPSEATWDLTADGAMAKLKELKAQGYAPVSWAAYEPNGRAWFAQMSTKPGSQDWELSYRVRLADLASRDRKLHAEGYSLADLTIYHDRGTAYAAPLWVRNGAAPQAQAATQAPQANQPPPLDVGGQRSKGGPAPSQARQDIRSLARGGRARVEEPR
jgi:hypothetical protein